MIKRYNIFKILFIITLVLLFLPAFVFYCGERTYRVFFIFLLTFFGLYIIKNPKSFFLQVYCLCNKTPFKYLAWFIIYLFASSIFMLFFNYKYGVTALFYVLQFAILYILPCFLLSSYFITKNNNLSLFIKIYFSALFAIFVFGLIDYFGGRILNVKFITSIQHFLANERYIGIESHFQHIRLCSVFAEPGWLGGFIFLNFPIIYKGCTSKFKIFKNNVFNILIKKSLIPLAWLNLIFTFSPIWLVFCLIQVVLIYGRNILKFLFKHCIFVMLLFLIITAIIVTIFKTFGINIHVIERIVNTLTNILNFNTLILAEPSLGSRLVSYSTMLHVFKEHPMLGVGLSNNYYYIADIIDKYSIPMTAENFANYQKYLTTGKMLYNPSTFYTLLSETGLIGAFLYYLLIYKLIRCIKYVKTHMQLSMMKDVACGLYLSLCFYVFMTFYDTVLANPFNIFFMGLVIPFYFYYMQQCCDCLQKQEEKKQ